MTRGSASSGRRLRLLHLALLLALLAGVFTAASAARSLPGRQLRASSAGARGWQGATELPGLRAGEAAMVGTRPGGRRLSDVCQTLRCVEDIPVCPRCALSPESDAEVGHCREHGEVYECHRHPVTGALRVLRPPAAGNA